MKPGNRQPENILVDFQPMMIKKISKRVEPKLSCLVTLFVRTGMRFTICLVSGKGFQKETFAELSNGKICRLNKT